MTTTETEVPVARVRLTDTRLLIIFLLLVALLGLGGTWVVASLRAINSNCLANQDNTMGFNDFVGQLQVTTAGSRLLSYEERKQRVAFYQLGKQPVPKCPTPPGGESKPKTSPPPPAPPVPLTP